MRKRILILLLIMLCDIIYIKSYNSVAVQCEKLQSRKKYKFSIVTTNYTKKRDSSRIPEFGVTTKRSTTVSTTFLPPSSPLSSLNSVSTTELPLSSNLASIAVSNSTFSPTTQWWSSSSSQSSPSSLHYNLKKNINNSNNSDNNTSRDNNRNNNDNNNSDIEKEFLNFLNSTNTQTKEKLYLENVDNYGINLNDINNNNSELRGDDNKDVNDYYQQNNDHKDCDFEMLENVNLAREGRKLILIPRLKSVESDVPVRYDEAQLWKIHTRKLNENVIKKIRLIGGEIWNMNQDGIDIFLTKDMIPKAREIMTRSLHTFNVMIDNVQEAIDDSNEFNRTDEIGSNYMISWDNFHGLSAIYSLMDVIMEHFPNMIQILTVGRSVERRDIKVLRVSNGNKNNPAIFIDGGMQGRDWASPATVSYLMFRLMRDWKKVPMFMTNIDWYFLPVLNPDGYEYSRTIDRLWSKSRRRNIDCNGVNLDRNFGFKWSKEGSSKYTCSRMYRGRAAFSEPETKALRNIIHSLEDKLAGYISIGGYGQAITYPWGDDDVVPDNYQQLHYVAKMAIRNMRKITGNEYRLGSSYQVQLPRAGNSADWVMDKYNPEYVYNLLLQDQGRNGYLLPPELIKETAEEAYEMIRTVARAIADIRPKTKK